MNRAEAELDLLRGWFGDSVDFQPDGQWVRLRAYRIPKELWKPSLVEVAFQIPQDVATNPYAFCARPANSTTASDGQRLLPATGGGQIGNHTYPASTPWGDDWGRFSWQLAEWRPSEPISAGTTVLDFARSIAARFQEGP